MAEITIISILMISNVVWMGFSWAYRSERDEIKAKLEGKIRVFDEKCREKLEFLERWRDERAVRENMEKRLMMIAAILNPEIEYGIEEGIEQKGDHDEQER